MADITEYPEKEELQANIEQAFEDGIEQEVNQPTSDAALLRSITLEGVAEVSEMGRGVGEMGQAPMQLIMSIGIRNEDELFGEDEYVPNSERLNEATESLAETIADNIEATETLQEWFTGPRVTPIHESQYEDYLKYRILQREPNRAYDVLRDQIIGIEGNSLTRSRVQQKAPEPVTQPGDDDYTPVDIIEFPEKEELEKVLNQAFVDATAHLLSEDQSTTADYELHVLRDILINPPWGNGTATYQEDELNVRVVIGLEGETRPNLVPLFDSRIQKVADQMESELDQFYLMENWFNGVSISAIADGLVENTIVRNLRSMEPPRIYNLSQDSAYELQDDEIVETEYQSVEDPQEVEPAKQEGPLRHSEQAKRVQRELELAKAYPEIEPSLREYANERGRVHIPAGKETKEVESRPMYEFEEELLSTQRPSDRFEIEVSGGIGESVATGRFGEDHAPGSFPRTGNWMKYRLYFEGPAYALELFNDLVVYTGFARSLREVNIKAGSYESMRQFLYRLQQVPKREVGPELIRPLSPSEAESRGLDTTPVIKTTDGEQEAPWLEPRQYYEVVEDEIDNPIWNNVTRYLEEAKAQ